MKCDCIYHTMAKRIGHNGWVGLLECAEEGWRAFSCFRNVKNVEASIDLVADAIRECYQCTCQTGCEHDRAVDTNVL